MTENRAVKTQIGRGGEGRKGREGRGGQEGERGEGRAGRGERGGEEREGEMDALTCQVCKGGCAKARLRYTVTMSRYHAQLKAIGD